MFLSVSVLTNLKSFGGSGELNGRPINRLIVGDIYPLGIGFTNNPAANVKGVMVKKINERENLLDKQQDRQDNIVEEKSSLLKYFTKNKLSFKKINDIKVALKNLDNIL